MLAKRPEISREICQKKIMKFPSHVLVMYDSHILFNILCIGSVRNKHVKGFCKTIWGFRYVPPIRVCTM